MNLFFTNVLTFVFSQVNRLPKMTRHIFLLISSFFLGYFIISVCYYLFLFLLFLVEGRAAFSSSNSLAAFTDFFYEFPVIGSVVTLGFILVRGIFSWLSEVFVCHSNEEEKQVASLLSENSFPCFGEKEVFLVGGVIILFVSIPFIDCRFELVCLPRQDCFQASLLSFLLVFFVGFFLVELRRRIQENRNQTKVLLEFAEKRGLEYKEPWNPYSFLPPPCSDSFDLVRGCVEGCFFELRVLRVGHLWFQQMEVFVRLEGLPEGFELFSKTLGMLLPDMSVMSLISPSFDNVFLVKGEDEEELRKYLTKRRQSILLDAVRGMGRPYFVGNLKSFAVKSDGIHIQMEGSRLRLHILDGMYDFLESLVSELAPCLPKDTTNDPTNHRRRTPERGVDQAKCRNHKGGFQ